MMLKETQITGYNFIYANKKQNMKTLINFINESLKSKK